MKKMCITTVQCEENSIYWMKQLEKLLEMRNDQT